MTFERNGFVVTNSDFFILTSLQPYVVDLNISNYVLYLSLRQKLIFICVE